MARSIAPHLIGHRIARGAGFQLLSVAPLALGVGHGHARRVTTRGAFAQGCYVTLFALRRAGFTGLI
jgi:hypothetical protein